MSAEFHLSDEHEGWLHAEFHDKDGCPFYPPGDCPDRKRVERLSAIIERIVASEREAARAEGQRVGKFEGYPDGHKAGAEAAERALVERLTKVAVEMDARARAFSSTGIGDAYANAASFICSALDIDRAALRAEGVGHD